MSDSRSIGREPSLRQSLGLDRHPLTGVKTVVLGVAILMMILGVVLALTTGSTPVPTADSASASPAGGERSHPDGGLLGHGFAQTRPSVPDGAHAPEPVGTPDATDDGLGVRDLSPFMVKGGFGLFIGFAIGFAMRAFLRLAVVVVGFYLLVLTMMAYVGWIEIHWNLMENQFAGLLESLGGQFESFRTFLTGAIPASGLTAAGFVVGLRRR
jgi:uncharacterized membrane protein (Fun14 family)